MRLRIPYLIAAILIFLIETLIALFVRDAFVRPYIGDVLAVVLVYCGLRAVTPLGVWPAIAASFATACAIEVGQYFHYVDRLGLGGSPIARIVLGTGFEPKDFLAYAAGATGVALAELSRRRPG